MQSTRWLAGLALVALTPLAAQATTATFDFYGNGPLLEQASTLPVFTNGALSLEVGAKAKGTSAQVVLSNTGLGVEGGAFANSIESNTGDALTLTFNQTVNLSAIQLSYWDKDGWLTTGDRATLSWGSNTLTLGTGSLQGTSGWESTSFSLSGVVGKTFTLTATGTGTQFRLAGLSATPAVPEPGTWATMGLGLLGVAALAQRRRRSAD